MGWSPAKFWAERRKAKAPEPPKGDRASSYTEWTPPPGYTVLYPVVPTPLSSWVTHHCFAMKADGTCGLIARFKSGEACFYPDSTEADYLSFDGSVSKGKWVHENIYTRRYEKI